MKAEGTHYPALAFSEIEAAALREQIKTFEAVIDKAGEEMLRLVAEVDTLKTDKANLRAGLGFLYGSAQLILCRYKRQENIKPCYWEHLEYAIDHSVLILKEATNAT